ncbi:MAG: cytidylate kinase family protein [Candidatus Poseidoniales archaeon]
MDLIPMSAKSVVTSGGEIVVEITISGHPGSGTSTLVEAICENKGWTSLNGGEIFRQEAKSRNLPLSEFANLCANDFSVDRYLDDILKSKMVETDGPKVMESRLSGWWAHLLELDCIRLWIEVSENVRAKRVVGREGISFEEALVSNSKRSEKDLARYEEMYGLNPEERTPYTHVIDASGLTKEEVLTSALKILEEVE